MDYAAAMSLASNMVVSMADADAVERVVIAGSLRRGKADVKDIELLVIAKRGVSEGLFGDLPGRNLLYDWAMKVKADGKMRWIKTGTNDIEDWKLDPEGKYWRGLHVRTNIKVDVWLVTPETWFPQLVIRTGCAQFSHQLMIVAERAGFLFYEGRVLSKTDSTHKPVINSEQELFELLGIGWLEPEQRTEDALPRQFPFLRL
jgi:DNA polymerase/3'-5' exonuclease PolX